MHCVSWLSWNYLNIKVMTLKVFCFLTLSDDAPENRCWILFDSLISRAPSSLNQVIARQSRDKGVSKFCRLQFLRILRLFLSYRSNDIVYFRWNLLLPLESIMSDINQSSMLIPVFQWYGVEFTWKQFAKIVFFRKFDSEIVIYSECNYNLCGLITDTELGFYSRSLTTRRTPPCFQTPTIAQFNKCFTISTAD